MTEDELEARVAALERALTDGREGSVDDLSSEAALEGSVESLRERLDELEGRLEELDAALQAVRGYVGEVRHVNREVERRAEAALAAVERLEGDADDRAGGRNGSRDPEPADVADPPGRETETGGGPGTPEGDGVGAWPPAEDDDDPDDVLSRVRDAL